MATTICLSIPEDLYEWLREEAERRGKKIQDIIREALLEIRALRRYRINKIFNILENLEDILEEINKKLE